MGSTPQELRIKNIEKRTGLSIQALIDINPDEYRDYLEKNKDKEVTYYSAFPTIGRGNVLRDRLITNKQLNDIVDEILTDE